MHHVSTKTRAITEGEQRRQEHDRRSSLWQSSHLDLVMQVPDARQLRSIHVELLVASMQHSLMPLMNRVLIQTVYVRARHMGLHT